jgi:hypothetical protein
VPGAKSFLAALKGGRRRIDSGTVLYPEHFLKQVMVPFGPKIGLQLVTVMGRPVVQAVTSPELRAQGVQPMDVLVSVGDVKLGASCSATRAAAVLARAKHDAVHGTFRIALLRMAPRDLESSYHAQHPVDVASALTAYDPASRAGTLSFSVPYALPCDKYKVVVFRYGSQVAPSTKAAASHRATAKAADQYLRITPDGKPHVLTHAEAAAAARLGDDERAAERRMQKEAAGKEDDDLRHRLLAAKYEAALKETAAAALGSTTGGPLGTVGEGDSESEASATDDSDLGDSSESE